MRELWLKTFELFRRHPVLWAPYACAELLAFSLSTLRRMAYKPILYWFARTTKASVLGGTATTYDWAKGQHEAILFSWPLEWGTRYVDACLLTCSLVITAVCIQKLAHVETSYGSSAFGAVRAGAKRIVIFALKFCAWTVVVTVALALPVSYVTFHLDIGQTKYFPISIAGAIVGMSIAAWIMIPSALALLRPSGVLPVAGPGTRLCRFFAILSINCIAVLEFAIPRLETHIQLRGRPAATALFAFNDLVIHLPLLFLFIALALIALEVPLSVAPEGTLHLPESIKNLMPLHYPPADEEQ